LLISILSTKGVGNIVAGIFVLLTTIFFIVIAASDILMLIKVSNCVIFLNSFINFRFDSNRFYSNAFRFSFSCFSIINLNRSFLLILFYSGIWILSKINDTVPLWLAVLLWAFVLLNVVKIIIKITLFLSVTLSLVAKSIKCSISRNTIYSNRFELKLIIKRLYNNKIIYV
jgi:hypothetical protein